jgi:hypothetical protein
VRWFEDVDCEAEFAGCLGSDLLCAIPAVVYESSDDLEPAIPEHAGAICLLEALRDRRRGLLELRWGIPFGVPYLNARIFAPKRFKAGIWSGGRLLGSRGIRAGGAWKADFSAFRAVRRPPRKILV